MSRRTLLDLLGTDQLPAEAEQQFIEFCLWQQAFPAVQDILEATGLAEQITLPQVKTVADLQACTQQAADLARQQRIPVLALGATQGMASEVEQMANAIQGGEVEADAVSFHAARLVGWATWAKNDFSTGMFKTTAEEVAYGEQLQMLMKFFGAKGL